MHIHIQQQLGLSQLFFFSTYYSIQNFPQNAPIIPKDCPIILNYNSELFPSKIKESAYKNMRINGLIE